MRWARAVGVALGLALAGPGQAAIFLFTATGTLEAPDNRGPFGQPLPVPPLPFAQGDAVRVSFTLDIARATATPVPLNQGSYTTYTVPVSDLVFRIGGYASLPGSGQGNEVTLGIFDNVGALTTPATPSADRLAFQVFRSFAPAGSGQVAQLDFDLEALDPTGQVRGSSHLLEEPPLASYGTVTGVFVAYVDGALVAAPVGNLSASLSAVPEPSAWGTMLAGMAATGLALRRRRGALASRGA